MKNIKTGVDFVGNCTTVAWDNLIKDLENHVPRLRPPTKSSNTLTEIENLWNEVGYKGKPDGGTAEWQMYDAGECFDKSIVDTIIEFAEIPHYTYAWISKIMPGYCAPPHFDVMKSDKTIHRMHVYPVDAQMGHVFYVGDQYITDYKKGDVYVWRDPLAWHAGMNCGLAPKYMLNIY